MFAPEGAPQQDIASDTRSAGTPLPRGLSKETAAVSPVTLQTMTS